MSDSISGYEPRKSTARSDPTQNYSDQADCRIYLSPTRRGQERGPEFSLSFKANSAIRKLELLNERRHCCISCLKEVGKIPIRKVFKKRVVLQKVFSPFCRYLDKTQVIFGKIVRIFFELNAIASLKESTALGNQTLKNDKERIGLREKK